VVHPAVTTTAAIAHRSVASPQKPVGSIVTSVVPPRRSALRHQRGSAAAIGAAAAAELAMAATPVIGFRQ
jgi:hypothetical protein